jgi:Asp-tRNA(Asn)/Glu-tRNA(Gln) amidotransferase A subunit family amidase
MTVPDLDIAAVRAAYASGQLTPSALVKLLYPRLKALPSCVFIHLVPLEELLARTAALEAQPAEQRGSLWGIIGAVKDNVDVGGMPTTAACPSFSYTPAASAPGVAALEDAGVIIVGKTNMDQFAAGLVSDCYSRAVINICAPFTTRSPHHTTRHRLAPARPTARLPRPLTAGLSLAAPPPVPALWWAQGCSALRWAPTRRGQAVCRLDCAAA